MLESLKESNRKSMERSGERREGQVLKESGWREEESGVGRGVV